MVKIVLSYISVNVVSSGFGEIRPPFPAYLCALNICHSSSSCFIYDKKETGKNFMNGGEEEEGGNGLHILCHRESINIIISSLF